eukprot:3908506-Rhodomonas_salina.1
MTSPYDPTSKRTRRPCDVYIKRTAVQQYVLAQITMRLTQPGNEDARIPHAGHGVFKWYAPRLCPSRSHTGRSPARSLT